MSGDLPEKLDVWRMVAQRREFSGAAGMSAFPRLLETLASTDGSVEFSIEFDTDSLGVRFVALRAHGHLPLICQRTLEPFAFPVSLEARLGLVRNEADEAALPPGYEALQVPADGVVRPLELIEDELLLALPVVPLSPRADEDDVVYRSADVPEPEERPNPFAALAALRDGKS